MNQWNQNYSKYTYGPQVKYAADQDQNENFYLN